MVEFAATLYAIETILSWIAGVAVILFFGFLIYQNDKFERSRKPK
jgi:hypothetical protein